MSTLVYENKEECEAAIEFHNSRLKKLEIKLKNLGWTVCPDDVNFGTSIVLKKMGFRLGFCEAVQASVDHDDYWIHAPTYFLTLNRERKNRVELEVSIVNLEERFIEIESFFYNNPDDLPLKWWMDWGLISKIADEIDEEIKKIWGEK